MKPGDHPEFFTRPPPEGRSRESTIVLDALGRFTHDGEPVQHRGLARGFARWIARHPDDDRFILTNGYDWCYFRVEDTPYFIRNVRLLGDQLIAELFDDTEEPLDLTALSVGADDVVRARVKQGRFAARFNRHAQLQLAPFLADDPLALVVGGQRYPIEVKGA